MKRWRTREMFVIITLSISREGHTPTIATHSGWYIQHRKETEGDFYNRMYANAVVVIEATGYPMQAGATPCLFYRAVPNR